MRTPRRVLLELHTTWTGLAGLVLLATAAACNAVGGRGEVRRDPGLSVLLITVDTLRADALGAYGHPAVQTPEIDRLAARGVRFDDAHAQNVVTLPSHANILSGRYPFDHGVRDNAGFRFPAQGDTLATLLKSRGYRTGAFVSAFPLDSRFGLGRGFDVYDDFFGDSETHTAFHMQERRGTDTVAAALRWLKAQGDARTFLWVHVYEPHFPYEPPEPFASRFKDDLYHGEVSAADAAVGPLLEPLLEAGTQGRTLVVLTGDHGEALGEHGEMTHGIFAYDATLHIPLLLFRPGLLKPRVVAEPARHVDVVPTVLDALGLPLPAGLAGRSLLSVAEGVGSAAGATSYFESLSPALNRGWAPIHGLIRDRLKYIELPIPELYDLATDPHETRNLVAQRAQAADTLRSLLSEARKADRGIRKEEETAETRERLKSLGYVTSATGGLKQRYTDDDDPKRLIPLEAANEEILARYSSGDLAGALALCQDLVRRRPMPLTLVHLAFLRRESGDLAGAVEAGRRALALNPDQTDVVALLGGYLNELGRSREAVALLEPFVRKPEPDLDVVTAYGMALAGSGRAKEALAAFERVRAIDPTSAMALVNIGTVHLMAKDEARARQAFEAALDIDPRVARAHNSLGVIAAGHGRYDEATERWKRAALLDPHNHETLYNLGTLLLKLGRPDEARPYLESYLREAPAATDARDIARVRQWLASTPARPR